jgi:hypothetical protein
MGSNFLFSEKTSDVTAVPTTAPRACLLQNWTVLPHTSSRRDFIFFTLAFAGKFWEVIFLKTSDKMGKQYGDSAGRWGGGGNSAKR